MLNGAFELGQPLMQHGKKRDVRTREAKRGGLRHRGFEARRPLAPRDGDGGLEGLEAVAIADIGPQNTVEALALRLEKADVRGIARAEGCPPGIRTPLFTAHHPESLVKARQPAPMKAREGRRLVEAHSHDRLVGHDECRCIFGAGNANTKEEVIGRPTAVGLFRNDRTPEGVYDLAGNAAEWSEEGVGNERWIHPGSWDQPSMAAWAKARESEHVGARWGGLGFRLVRGK